MDSDQRQRWVAMGLLEAEQRMRRIDNAAHLPLLRRAFLKDIRTKTPSAREPPAKGNFN